MKQFTDSRIDSDRLAHAARTKIVEVRIGELVVAVKRGVRASSAYRTVTLAQYDQMIIGSEKAVRKWLVTSPDRDLEELLHSITDAVDQLGGLVETEDINDLDSHIRDQVNLLNSSGFFSS